MLRSPLATAAAAALAISLFTITPRALAQDADAALATELFNAGRDLMKEGKYTEACPKLAESARLSEKVGTLGKLAECEDKTGHLVSARAHLLQALNLARSTRDDRAPAVEAELARIDKLVPKVRITVAADAPADLALQIDTTHLNRALVNVPIPVEPGRHAITASAPGKKPWTTNLELASDGAVTTVAIPPLEQGPASAVAPVTPVTPATPAGTDKPPSTPPSADEKSSSTLGTVGLVTAGAGVVAMGIGGVFGLMALSKKSDAEAAGCSGTACPPDAVSTRDDAKSAGNTSTILFVVGAVLAAGGVTLWLVAPRGSKSTASAALSPAGLSGTW